MAAVWADRAEQPTGLAARLRALARPLALYRKRAYTDPEQVPPPSLPPTADEPVPPGQPNPAEEGHPDDLVLEAWVHCVAKHSYRKSRSDYVEHAHGVKDERTQSNLWRRRRQWIKLDCGEDSFFVSNTRLSVGVADGVGAWREYSIDPSELANKLMERAKLHSEGGAGDQSTRGALGPMALLQKAWADASAPGLLRGGSTTALIATLESDDNAGRPPGSARGRLRVANLGDGGLKVVRRGRVAARSGVTVHRVSVPRQLCVAPSLGMRKRIGGKLISDPPEAALQEAFPIQEDDVVVVGTDGYFANVPEEDCARWCSRVLNSTGDYSTGWWTRWWTGTRADEPRVPAGEAARLMVREAVAHAKDPTWISPYSRTLIECGVPEQEAVGGLADDITLVLARVVRRRNWHKEVGARDTNSSKSSAATGKPAAAA